MWMVHQKVMEVIDFKMEEEGGGRRKGHHSKWISIGMRMSTWSGRRVAQTALKAMDEDVDSNATKMIFPPFSYFLLSDAHNFWQKGVGGAISKFELVLHFCSKYWESFDFILIFIVFGKVVHAGLACKNWRIKVLSVVWALLEDMGAQSMCCKRFIFGIQETQLSKMVNFTNFPKIVTFFQ